jgi:hypothetical protein
LAALACRAARRKLEAAQAQLANEYQSLDTLEARMAELERIRRDEEVRRCS